MISRSSSPRLSVDHRNNLYKCVSIFVIRGGRGGHERFIGVIRAAGRGLDSPGFRQGAFHFLGGVGGVGGGGTGFGNGG